MWLQLSTFYLLLSTFYFLLPTSPFVSLWALSQPASQINLAATGWFPIFPPKIYLLMTKATIQTEKGDMQVEFYDKDAPNTVANFVKLSKDGFYDGVTFHRVIPDFVIQGGDPTGTGAGGPGYTIDCELDGDNQYHDRGVLSMAHAGRNTGGSQFFICHSRKNTAHLDRNHTCFGKVVEGLDVIDDIRQGDKILKVLIQEES
jgi:peptidyl-prolyl cis-trans isomerase B (cyclophilin B)